MFLKIEALPIWEGSPLLDKCSEGKVEGCISREASSSGREREEKRTRTSLMMSLGMDLSW
jgi:hypothetical protein